MLEVNEYVGAETVPDPPRAWTKFVKVSPAKLILLEVASIVISPDVLVMVEVDPPISSLACGVLVPSQTFPLSDIYRAALASPD